MGGICCGQRPTKQYKKTMLNFKDLKATYNLDTKPLGKGSFGTVYRGTNKANSNVKIAIKAINKRALSENEIEQIHQEVQIIQTVDHPNIINYYETYEDKNCVYLCMELCQGGELIGD